MSAFAKSKRQIPARPDITARVVALLDALADELILITPSHSWTELPAIREAIKELRAEVESK